jgi:lipoprotein-anchoring transpeptidase ErfK/SrfK
MLLALGLAAGSLLGAGGPDSRGHTPGASAAAPPSARRPPSVPRGASVVANVQTREALVYRSPHARRPWLRLPNPTRERTPLVFLVRHRSARWLRVLLPTRPNGAEGWLHTRGVLLRANPYALQVNLSSHRLLLRRRGHVVLRTPVGVGRAATPTPTGLYYVTELLRQPDPRGTYGPWAFALSAFSPVLSHFGAGPGQIGLHGTDDPMGIGHTVSHGCIRVRNAVIERLARLLPLGTPVRILAHPRSPRPKFTRT